MAAFHLSKTRLIDLVSLFVSDQSFSEVQKLLSIFKHCIALCLSFLHVLLSGILRSYPPKLGLSTSLASPPQQHDSAAARGLSQVFSLVAAVPVASRKYVAVRSLADALVEGNLREGSANVNRDALSAAFSTTVRLLEAETTLARTGTDHVGLPASLRLAPYWWLRVVGLKEDRRSEAGCGEKLAAELLWLARKLGECGAGEDAVSIWGSASALARLSLSAEPRLQASVLRTSVYLFKQAKELEEEEGRERTMKMLMTWLPFLCHANNGIDVPVLSSIEKAEMVKILEKMIEGLNLQKQEKVLALWLHNFMSSANSDWPDLQACYTRWYTNSRRLTVD